MHNQKMFSFVDVITPQKAAEYLSKNNKNRRLNDKVVKRYANDMAAGHWTLTHQGIAFDSEGFLLDGQHRLNAIIKCGRPVSMLVTKNMDKKSARDMDCGVIRNESHQISMHGSVEITKNDVSRAKFLLYSKNGHTKPTLSEIEEYFKLYKKSFAIVPNRGERFLSAAPIMSAFIAGDISTGETQKIERFADIFSSGFYDSKSDQLAISLRNHVIKEGKKYQTNNTMREHVFLLTCVALDWFLSGHGSRIRLPKINEINGGLVVNPFNY